MIEDEFTRALRHELARELDGVPLPASQPLLAHYRAQGRLGGDVSTSARKVGRTLGVLGAVGVALMTGVVVASAAPGIPAWAVDAQKVVTAIVKPAPAQPAVAPTAAPHQAKGPETGSSGGASGLDQLSSADRALEAGRQKDQKSDQERDAVPAQKRAEEHLDQPAEIAQPRPEELDRDRSHGVEKEKTSDFSSHRSSSGKP